MIDLSFMYESTTDIESLCPFTGLRSFTEEESIYFKGRDVQIDSVAAQLAERKFLMLTGASGDGKSSLIYAGLIPQAKSGFFKARFNNWAIVDFRPERSPLNNLFNAVARTFRLDPSSVETELSRGFSALADLYLNSNMFLEATEMSTLEPGAERRQKQLKTSNLLIIIDQFEEFFTNPENFHGDSPSHDAQLVVNLMLETSRIALAQGLPIYVVFTMRSDYIGQCSAFRGLPEFIGYSQFFVPRLSRNELKQVIEEPAALNGNSITHRLAERLIFDLNDGVDQLPILQHALRQIWLRAMEMGEQMDLIHYAMVGGMPANQLPQQDSAKFNVWLAQLPENQRILYEDARLVRVIEIHARRLYDQAPERFASRSDQVVLNNRQVKNCIAIAFACLTKIDNGRAVRNRMSLLEISEIINMPAVTPEVLADILEVFRLPDNSFVRPFTFEVSGTLAADTVLDITHESLIRNWGMLDKWANQEFTYYSIFEDIAKQLKRWKSSGNSSAHLIPIGPLTFFEKWFEDCKPNAAWIQRYTEKTGDALVDRANAELLLSDLRRYLRLSAQRVTGSRLLVRYGARKILSVFAGLLLAVVGVYALFSVYRKHPTVVIRQVISEGRTLFKSSDVPLTTKSAYLLSEEYHSPGAGFNLLTPDISVQNQFSIVWGVYQMLYPSATFHGSAIRDSIIIRFKKILAASDVKTLKPAKSLEMHTRFVEMLATDNYFDSSAVPRDLLVQNAKALYELITTLSQRGVSADESVVLNEAIQLWLTFGNPSQDQLQHLILIFSPRQPQNRFNEIYQPSALEVNGYRSLTFGGGYHMLACLYAAVGDVSNVLWCFEQQQNITEYFTDRLLNTRSNVIGFLYQYGHRHLITQVVEWLTSHFPQVRAHQIYDDLVCRSAYLSELDRLKFGYKNNSEGGILSLNLCLSSRSQYESIVADYEQSVSEIRDPTEREFLLALHYKRLGLFSERYHSDRRLAIPENLESYYRTSLSHFANLNEGDRKMVMTFPYYYYSEIRTQSLSRQQMFHYPDVVGNWQHSNRNGQSFFAYLAAQGLLKSTYTSVSELRYIPQWLLSTGDRWFKSSTTILHEAIDFVDKHPQGSQVDMNTAKIQLALHYFADQDTAHGMSMSKRIDIPLLEATRQRAAGVENMIFLNELAFLSGRVAASGNPTLAAELNKGFFGAPSKAMAFLNGVEAAIQQKRPDVARIMLDSATHLVNRYNSRIFPLGLNVPGHYNNAAYAAGNKDHIKLADELYRNSLEASRINIVYRRIRGLVQRGALHDAMHFIPSTLTEGQDITCRAQLLETFTRERGKSSDENNKIYDEMIVNRLFFIGFFNN